MEFGNESTKNVIIFWVDNSSSSHTDNLKNDFIILGEGPTFGINGSFGASEKKFNNINFSKAKTKFCLSLHYKADNSYLFVNRKEIYKSKASNKNNNFPSQFCLGSIFNEFNYVDSEKMSFKGNVYHYSVDYGAFDKSNILNIQKYLMNKNSL